MSFSQRNSQHGSVRLSRAQSVHFTLYNRHRPVLASVAKNDGGRFTAFWIDLELNNPIVRTKPF